MSASSSRIMIPPSTPTGHLGDRLIAHLLEWYDTGSGYRLRRWCRHHTAQAIDAARGGLARATRHVIQRPVVQRISGTALPALRMAGRIAGPPLRAAITVTVHLARRTAARLPTATTPTMTPPPSRSRQATVAPAIRSADRPENETARPTREPAPVSERPTPPPSSQPTTRAHRTRELAPVASERGTTTAIRRPGTRELAPVASARAATTTTRRPGTRELAPVPPPAEVAVTPPPRLLREPTLLRCWSCLRRVTISAPRRGGCYHCGGCSVIMLVVDPFVGLTCDVAQATTRGIRYRPESDETDPG